MFNVKCQLMKNRLLTITLIISLLILSNLQVFSCTNFIITKGASKDGSTMVTYSADSHTLYGELYYRPAGTYPIGTMMDVIEWDSGKKMGQIPQATKTYSVVGNMNEHQLAIGETTYGGLEALSAPNGIMDYGSLIYITLQRAKNAREAIKTISFLLENYGYCSSGESFSIIDPNEAWIFELIGKGEEMKDAKGKTLKGWTKGVSGLHDVFLTAISAVMPINQELHLSLFQTAKLLLLQKSWIKFFFQLWKQSMHTM